MAPNRSLALFAGSIALVASFTGCAGRGQPAPAASPGAMGTTSPAERMCDAQPVQGIVGRSSTASTVEAARTQAGAQMARILRPGQMVTKEFNTQRLNLEVDATGRILSVHCG